mgnify:CR=1 FL=1
MKKDAQVEAKKECLDAGMMDYCTKPLNIDALKNTLEKWLPK